MALLRILNGSLENQEVELSPDPMTIGRASACNIRIADSGVSSKHAKIWCENGQYFLMDLGSTNGTFVNEKDVDREQLSDGDVITFGMTKASFVGDQPRARPAPARGMPQRAAIAPGRARGAGGEPEVAPEGIVTDEPRGSAFPPLRREVRTQDEVEIATLRGKVAFFEEENRKLKVQMKQVQEQAAHDAAASARADAEKIRTLLKQRKDELKKLQKERGELVQELAKARQIIAKVGGAEEAAAAVEEQNRATLASQERITQLEGELAKARDAASVIGGKLDSSEATLNDLRKQLGDAEAQVAEAVEARMKVEGQLSELLRKSGDRDQHEKQLAMLKADRDARTAEAKAAAEARDAAEQQLAKIRGTYEDIVHDRDELKAKIEALQSEMRVAATGNQLRGDWEARFQSAADERDDLKKLVSRMRIELLQAREAAARSGGGTSTVDEGLLRLVGARADVHETLVAQMLEGVNNAVSLLRRNSELLKGYVEDCGLLANAVRKIDYTRLEPEQQQMLVELVDQTQPDVIVKNMQGIGEENAESIVKAKKLILDYSDAFKKEDGSVEVEAALAKAQGLLHATDPNADVPVKIEAVLPTVDAGKEETVLFCFALLREAKLLSPEDGGPATVNVNTDGLSVTFTLAPVEAKAKERYREPADAQARLVSEFARGRCGGKAEFKEEDGKRALLVTLKAKV